MYVLLLFLLFFKNLFGVTDGTEITRISFNDSDSLMIHRYF